MKCILITVSFLFFFPWLSFASSTGTITNDITTSIIAAFSSGADSTSVAGGVNVGSSDLASITNDIVADGGVTANASKKKSTAIAGGINIEDGSIAGNVINSVTTGNGGQITAEATGDSATAVAAGVNLQNAAFVDGDITLNVNATSITAMAEKKSTAVAAGISVK